MDSERTYTDAEREQIHQAAKEILLPMMGYAGIHGGYWCATCQEFVWDKVDLSVRGTLVLRWHRVGKATHTVRRVEPLQPPPRD
jgi:hypothetical protein